MNRFITIIHTADGGLASYTVYENKDHYKAALIKCISTTALPQEVLIDKRLDHNIESSSDLVKHKLINTIKQAEAADEGIA